MYVFVNNEHTNAHLGTLAIRIFDFTINLLAATLLGSWVFYFDTNSIKPTRR